MRAPALLLLLAAVACATPPPPPALPLFDADHTPEVLVEARELARPPDPGGNRFLTGWWPRRTGDGVVLVPDSAGALLEAVSLGTAPRRLRLALAGPVPAGGTLAVAVAGRDLPPVALSGAAVEVALPADLPRGRFPVTLRFPGDDALAVRGAGFDRALPAGEVSVAGGDLRQGGVSLVEVVRPLRGAVRLVGRFVPPTDPAPGQRFELRVGDGDSERLAWAWEAGWGARLRGARTLDLPVAPAGGWLTVRLLAATPGPAASWEGLGLAVDGTAEPSPAGGERAARAAAPGGEPAAEPGAAATAGAPPQVVVLYALDALRADAVGHLGGGPAVTPTIDALAAAGATFRRHLTPAPNTLPSTKTLLTGRVWRQRGGWALAATGTETLAELFRRAGYRTGLFSGNVYVSPAYGIDRGFEVAPQETLFDSYAERERPPFNDNAARVNAAALAWLGSLGPDERAFLYLHPVLPHNPYDPPEPFRSRFAPAVPAAVDGSTETLLAVRNQRLALDDAGRERIAGLYRGGLASADAALGELLAALAARYPAERVLVALTSDHGEELFDHGGVLHGYTLYDEQLHVPLVVRWPGRVPAGLVVETPTTTAQLHRALRVVAGAEAGGPTAWERLAAGGHDRGDGGGTAGEAAPEPQLAAAASVKGGIFMARTPRWKVVWAPRTGTQWGVGEGLGRNRDAEAVYDLAADPGERVNLAGLAGAPEVRWLRARLLAWSQVPEPDEEAEAPVEDAETRRKLEALGYAN